jgi:sulfur-carrier protein adenylyltransferase/sulfurtransferase
MNKKYLLLAFIAVALGAGMLLMPVRPSGKQVQPVALLAAVDDPSRFLSTDDITDRLVKKDPALLLIDVRPAAQFQSFSIPGSINLPLDSLLTPAAQDLLSMKEMDKVFCSNSEVSSDQAWILSKRSGHERIYVMQGGVNAWFATIVKPEKPAETSSSDAIRLYSFRMGARQHFFGQHTPAQPGTGSEEKKVNVVKKSSGAASGGGC